MKNFFSNGIAICAIISVLLSSCQQNENMKIIECDGQTASSCIQDTMLETRAVTARLPTQEEKAVLHSFFPAMNVDAVSVTDENTSTYNCVANAMGIYSMWINPSSYKTGFENQFKYAMQNYGAMNNYEVVPVASSVACVDGWGTSSASMRHASRSIGGAWESKLGQYIRISHARGALYSAIYGRLQTSLIFSTSMNSAMSLKEVAESLPKAIVTPEEIEYIQRACEKVDPTVRKEFEKRLMQWNQAIKSEPAMLLSNDTHDYAKQPQFAALVEMGEEIIPLVLDKLCDEENFHVLILYDALQEDATKRIEYSEDDVRVLEGEQNRARRTIKQWVEKTKGNQ